MWSVRFFAMCFTAFVLESAAENPWPMYGQGPAHAHVQRSSPVLADGAAGWTFKTGGLVYGAPAVGEDETVYASSWDGHLYALHPNGSVRWKFLIKAHDQIWSSPALAPCSNCTDTVVYLGGSESLLAVGLTAAGQPALRWSIHTRAPVLASPTVGSDGNIYIGGLDSSLRAVSPAGTVLWEYRPSKGGRIYASAALGSEAAFYATMGGEVSGWSMARQPRTTTTDLHVTTTVVLTPGRRPQQDHGRAAVGRDAVHAPDHLVPRPRRRRGASVRSQPGRAAARNPHG
jgi:hypothetical protein